MGPLQYLFLCGLLYTPSDGKFNHIFSTNIVNRYEFRMRPETQFEAQKEQTECLKREFYFLFFSELLAMMPAHSAL